MLRCIFAPNLEIVTSIDGELWHGQAQNGVNFDFEVKFDLEVITAHTDGRTHRQTQATTIPEGQS